MERDPHFLIRTNWLRPKPTPWLVKIRSASIISADSQELNPHGPVSILICLASSLPTQSTQSVQKVVLHKKLSCCTCSLTLWSLGSPNSSLFLFRVISCFLHHSDKMEKAEILLQTNMPILLMKTPWLFGWSTSHSLSIPLQSSLGDLSCGSWQVYWLRCPALPMAKCQAAYTSLKLRAKQSYVIIVGTGKKNRWNSLILAAILLFWWPLTFFLESDPRNFQVPVHSVSSGFSLIPWPLL